jgi:hypothetical protein
VTLFNATSENDCTLLEEDGEYFVTFANRTGTYRESAMTNRSSPACTLT